MTESQHAIVGHYGIGGILDSILSALDSLAKDMSALAPSDLAPVDAFHIRGLEATVELADRAGIVPGLRVLDVGSGLGGSVRYLAAERACYATGLDVTEE
jgi:SAM-dependent methyltransferase